MKQGEKERGRGNVRMQQYLKLEIQNEILRTQNFVKICETAALKDDNQIDEAEKKLIKKIDKATSKYIKDLKKALGIE